MLISFNVISKTVAALFFSRAWSCLFDRRLRPSTGGQIHFLRGGKKLLILYIGGPLGVVIDLQDEKCHNMVQLTF